MNNNQKGQVQLSRLIFTHNWEDPTVDEEALQIKPGDTLFTITSGGCNALGFLRFDPSFIYCLDINPAQTALLELKKAAFACLAYDEMLEFLGLRPNSNRLRMYDEIKKKMSAEARYFWDHHSTIIKRGINMGGRYERFSKMAGMLVRFLQGEKKTRDFFQLETLEEQAEFYNKNWDNRRWRWIFNRMFNKKRLAGKGLDADYFHFDDGSASFSESFYRRAGHAMTNIPAASNYFLCLYLLGHYRDEDHLPDYLQQKNFEIIRKNIGRLRPVTGDGKYWLQQQPANLFDAMSLSNICELMDDKDTHTLFSEVERTAKKSARLIFRNLMVPREVPEV
ncbi:MAG TPA: DUF3419 family protein, partial [Puia sp.]|nr:DUF3419 family protein [Puia sp.]